MSLPPMTLAEQKAYNTAYRKIAACHRSKETALNLNQLGLTILPREIGQLTALKELHLGSNQLVTLPPEIGLLTALTQLDLRSNELTTLPPEIGQLTNLDVIRLDTNRLSALPPEIGLLAALTHINAAANQLARIPSEIAHLSALSHLNLCYNKLSELPPEIAQLSSLKALLLTENDLSVLPWEVYQLITLTHLHLDKNQLHSLSPEIGRLNALTVLNLSSNQLTTLPPEIGRLTELRQLFLSSNQLAIVPPEVGQLSSVEWLDLSSNRISTLPPQFGQLSELTRLYFASNRLSNLPSEIGQLTALIELDLSENQLADLPAEIGKLTALMSLNLNTNQLNSLPPEIGQLIRLIDLDLSINQLSTLPAEIGRLNALSTLLLHSNHLSTLLPEIGRLTELSRLDIGANGLVSLPPEIGGLTSLNSLLLDANKLVTLPSEIGQLTALNEIHLMENRLTALPGCLRKMPRLAVIFLQGNHELGLPPSILGGYPNGPGDEWASADSIFDFYFRTLNEEKRPLNEVKLLLVGRGEAGKTSVSRALRGEEFDAGQKETPGIEIEPWDLQCPGADDVKVYLWDFAGQEITHETHRFFLTERSLYLVVLDGRGGQQMEEAEYWLSHVQRYGTRYRSHDAPEHSPVIVVLNKWRSPGPYDVEKRRLQREHPNIRAFVETDCKEGYGMDDLKKTLRAVIQEMPSVRQEWPLTYYNVRRKLQALAENSNPARRRYFVNWKGYREICEECEVIELSEQTSMAENLNALGVALYYGDHDRLRDTRVLNPNWVANGLYGLVRGVHRKPHLGKPGYLWAGEFPAVLKEGMDGMNRERGATYKDYPKEREGVKVHDFLLELMQDRELAFLAREEKGHALYLLPGLLSLDEPELKDYDIGAHIEGAQVRFRYLYELLPPGVMSRFIVRTHTLSENYFRWQRGTVLAWGDARALVMSERRRNPRVDVFIIGGTPEKRQELAGVVRSNMEMIHEGLPEGLVGKEEVDLTIPGVHYESVEKLMHLEWENLPVQVLTNGGAHDVDVAPQLDQLLPAEARGSFQPALKVFVSYSHADYKLWDRFKPYLDILKNDGFIHWWFDGKIREGSDWDGSIRRELKEADLVILLMSTPFFASNYINGVELKEAERRRQQGMAEILPVLLSPCESFSHHSWLKKLQTVPSVNGRLRPLSSFSPAVNGWHLVDVALRKMIKRIASEGPGLP